MNASPSPFSAHSDVLDAAVPADAAGKERLLTELKNRGKAAVTAGHWPDAQALYEKALQCCSTDNSNEEAAAAASNQKAILYSNISLVQGKMNHWSEAKHSATDAVGADPAYTKGWWRLGQAQASLKEFDDAVKSLEEAAKLEPSNKALQKELTKQKENAKKAAAEKAKKEAEDAKMEEAEKAKASAPASSSTSKVTKSATKKSESKPEPMQIDDDDDTKFTKSEHVKGYKIVNGKKTSYFHNELSEEAKRLIGDIAPKKIESAPSAPVEASESNKGTSAWNKAGTWEERDVAAWAKDSLKEQLEKVIYTLPASSPAPSAVVKMTKAKVSGHASVAVVRGKKRFIYEMSVDLEWSFSHESNDANGKISFPDIDGTCMVGEPYEASGFDIEHSDDGQLRPVLESFVHKQGFRDKIHEAIDAWVELFKETYWFLSVVGIKNKKTNLVQPLHI